MFDISETPVSRAFVIFSDANFNAERTPSDRTYDDFSASWLQLMATPCSCSNDLSMKAKSILAYRDQVAPWGSDTFNDPDYDLIKFFCEEVALWASRPSTALHEAGHAVAGARLFGFDRLSEIRLATNPRSSDEGEAGSVVCQAGQDDPALSVATFAASGYAAMRTLGHGHAFALIGCEQDKIDAGENWECGVREACDLLSRKENQNAVRLVSRILERDSFINVQLLAVILDFSDGEISVEDMKQAFQLYDVEPIVL